MQIQVLVGFSQLLSSEVVFDVGNIEIFAVRVVATDVQNEVSYVGPQLCLHGGFCNL